ncbi:MAG: hypothetical protein U0992_15110 [Planctomycetaceae bacterium]
MHELRRILAYVSVLVGAIFLAGGVLISLAICLELKDGGLSALKATVIRPQMMDPILCGSVLLSLGGLLLFDGLRELTTRFKSDNSHQNLGNPSGECAGITDLRPPVR